MHAAALLLFLVATPVARLPGGDVTTAILLSAPITATAPAQKAAPKPVDVHLRTSAHNMTPVIPHVVIAIPAPITPVMPVPVEGPISVAEIARLAGAPLALTLVTASTSAMPVSTSSACDLTDPVQAALLANPVLRAQLPMIPARERSVANAIMVWNAGWLPTGDAAARYAYATIRETVARAVMAASDQCRSQIQSGPRLVYLPGDRPGQTTVLALGSGQWSWQQVADTAGLQPNSTQFSAANTPIVPHASLKTGEE